MKAVDTLFKINKLPSHFRAATMHYRRNYSEGGSYFFTVILAERKQRLLIEHIAALRESIRSVRSRHPFQIEAIVVMPDHLHTIFTLPPGDADYPTRWMLIKAGFSRQIPKIERISASRRNKGERGYGNAGFGNTPCKTKPIFATTSITSITTRSNTVTSPARPTGHIPASIDTSVTVNYPPIGAPPPPKTTNDLGSVGWGEARTPTRRPFHHPPTHNTGTSIHKTAIDVGRLNRPKCWGSCLTPTYARPTYVVAQLQQLTCSILVAYSVNADLCQHYATQFTLLKTAGTPIGANGLWIACHALAQNATLVTHNLREFERIQGLRLEDWVF